MRKRPRADAVRFRRLAFNTAASKRWLVFDIDDCDAMDAPREACLPMPTLAIVNRRDGRGHLAYRLRSPVAFSDHAREAPRRFMSDVERDMTLVLGADRAYTGPLAKNPLHRDFRTFATGRDFELRELAAHVDRDAARVLRARVRSDWVATAPCLMTSASMPIARCSNSNAATIFVGFCNALWRSLTI
ncbi:replication initiation protein [Rhodomicrobium udaipurense]|uniref:Replication initiation protein n=1 Tax=Rhodomicrobium udaipurense TaxID=1202716 RepID=A0A8I1KLD2_9HYPH|nr:replication initiation protein [Rhodomicrobium udaipurense]